MDLQAFRLAVDRYPDRVTPILGNLDELYRYVGLPVETSFSQDAARKALYEKITQSFRSGHAEVWRRCRDLREELIQSHVLDGQSLDPYYSILSNLLDAIGSGEKVAGNMQGDWVEAIHHAYDCVRIKDWSAGTPREKIHARSFEVARAAKRLRDRGYPLNRSGHFISIEPAAETRLVARVEQLAADAGGLNVARRIFAKIAPLYDPLQERYHVVNHPQTTGGGQPQIPFGYLVLLAAKHFVSHGPKGNTDPNWVELLRLSTDYAAVFDVQEYTHAWHSMDAVALIPYLRALALYDTLFRIPQIRGSDIEKLARGILQAYDFDEKRGGGWTLNDLLKISHALLENSREPPGPHRFDVRKLRALLPELRPEVISTALEEVLCHPRAGANQRFSKPTDAPTDEPGGKEMGPTFYSRPLLSRDRKTFWLLDRSVCAAAFFEALLTPLRAQYKDFDGNLGPFIETFVRSELVAHQIPFLTGDYDVDGEHGECDVVIETSEAIIFLEIKKKPLTRRAQAGSDAHVLIDLANSLLEAQVQAGWHEVRLRKHGHIDLVANGTKARLELKERQIERIAMSLLQFGSFQDRILLKQFLEATLYADFSANDPSLTTKFTKLTGFLAELRQQVKILHAGKAKLDQPFFHCWFLSLPQLLVLFDGVNGAEAFKTALWKTRHIVTGSSDFYFDNAFMRGWLASGSKA